MLELLDRIKERNFGRKVELKAYSGDVAADFGLLKAGIGAYSLYVDGQDMRVTLYDFNTNTELELDTDGEPDDNLEIDNIITKMIRLKYN